MTDDTEWSDVYQTQVLDVKAPWGWSRHLRVYRHDGQGAIPWDDLQRIKNAVLGAETTAIELYPPESLLVNEYNMRHLWTIPRALLADEQGFIGFGF